MNTKEYIDRLNTHLDPIQDKLLKDESERDDVCPSVGKELGRLLYTLILANKPKRVLEIGTSMGYGAIWMGLALKEYGGKLITIEYHERLVKEANKNIEAVGLEDVVEVMHGDAEEMIDQIEGDFDMILQDAGTRVYKETLVSIINKLSKGGLLIADDVLFAISAKRVRPRENISSFNERIFNDEELFSTILPLGDGLSLSVKK